MQIVITASVIVGILLYLAAVVFADAGTIGHQAMAISGETWGLILGLSCLNYGLRFMRWDWFVRHNGGRIPILHHATIYIAGFSLTTTPGKAGEAIRSLYLTRYGIAMHDSFASLFVERLIDMISITAMAVLAVGLLTSGPTIFGISVALVISATILLRGSLPEKLARQASAYFKHKGVKKVTSHIASLFESSRSLLTPGIFLTGNFIGLIAWAAEGVGFYILLVELGVEISFVLALGIYSTSVLIGALSFLPGGLGTTEVAMIGMLTAIGADPSMAVLAAIVCRLVTLWFAVGLGVIAMMIATRFKGNLAEAGQCL